MWFRSKFLILLSTVGRLSAAKKIRTELVTHLEGPQRHWRRPHADCYPQQLLILKLHVTIYSWGIWERVCVFAHWNSAKERQLEADLWPRPIEERDLPHILPLNTSFTGARRVTRSLPVRCELRPACLKRFIDSETSDSWANSNSVLAEKKSNAL